MLFGKLEFLKAVEDAEKEHEARIGHQDPVVEVPSLDII